jgi:hypothetical protein
MVPRCGEGQNVWLPRKLASWVKPDLMVPQRILCLGAQGSLSKRESIPNTSQMQCLTVSGMHIVQMAWTRTIEATGARFGNHWLALSILSQKMLGRGVSLPICDFWILASPMTHLKTTHFSVEAQLGMSQAECWYHHPELGGFCQAKSEGHSFLRQAFVLLEQEKSLFPSTHGYSKLQCTSLPILTHVHRHTHTHTRGEPLKQPIFSLHC